MASAFKRFAVTIGIAPGTPVKPICTSPAIKATTELALPL
jgi:hypothetical protein